MAGKLGMGLLETLIENLDRDLNLANTTLTNPIITTSAACDFTGAAVTGLEQYVGSGAVTQIGSGAVDVALNLTQPAGTVITDIGLFISTATVGSGNTVVRVGTSDDGEELCADTNLISSAVGAIGTGLSVANGAKSEGAGAMSLVALPVMYSAAARTIYIRAQNSATLTAGEFISYIKFIKLV